MPWAPAHRCNWPGCSNLTHERFCAECQPRAYHRSNSARPPVDRRYGTALWQRIRKAVLAAEPMCRECRRRDPARPQFAQEVDHIQPIEDGGEFFSITNLQPLCKPCHSRKTLGDLRRRGSLPGTARPAEAAYAGPAT
jgi:5-methylcytosine-specific restriction protein A